MTQWLEVKKYADASLTSKSIFVAPNSPETSQAETWQVRAHCWLPFKAAALGLSSANYSKCSVQKRKPRAAVHLSNSSQIYQS